MSENNNNVQCQCNEKELCCKMQKESLRRAISYLKEDRSSDVISRVLQSIYNVLSVYKCLPSTCLLDRVKWVSNDIGNSTRMLYSEERAELDMLIVELEAFLDS